LEQPVKKSMVMIVATVSMSVIIFFMIISPAQQYLQTSAG
jgi:preprotein translocase subunit YajC